MTKTELENEQAYADFEQTLTELIGRKLYGPDYRDNVDQLNEAEYASLTIRAEYAPLPPHQR